MVKTHKERSGSEEEEECYSGRVCNGSENCQEQQRTEREEGRSVKEERNLWGCSQIRDKIIKKSLNYTKKINIQINFN